MEEIWKDIGIIKGIDYTGLYQVSNYGQVRSLYDGRHKKYRELILKQQTDKKGYLSVGLYKNEKCTRERINRIVAITFIPIPEELKDIPIEELEVDHIDGNPKINKVQNLRWTDRSGNMLNPITRQRLSNTKKGTVFTEEHKLKLRNNSSYSKSVLQINPITNEVIAEFPSASEAARHFGIYHSGICGCCNGKKGYNTAGGYKWQYK